MNARQQAKAAGAMEAMIHAPRTAQRQATDLRIAEDMAPLRMLGTRHANIANAVPVTAAMIARM